MIATIPILQTMNNRSKKNFESRFITHPPLNLKSNLQSALSVSISFLEMPMTPMRVRLNNINIRRDRAGSADYAVKTALEVKSTKWTEKQNKIPIITADQNVDFHNF